MPKYVQVAAHLAPDELEQHYRQAVDPVERSHFQIIWLLACGKRVREVAEVTGDSRELDQDSGAPLQPGGANGPCRPAPAQ